jgi:hypothetical protein
MDASAAARYSLNGGKQTPELRFYVVAESADIVSPSRT